MSDSGSIRSSGTSRYRKVASGSTVDESLFGDLRNSRKRLNRTKRDNVNNKVCVSSKEIERIRSRSHAPFAADSSSYRCSVQDIDTPNEKSERLKRAKARKEHMLSLEATAKLNARKTCGEEISDLRAQAIRKQAQEKIDQSSEIAKLLTTLQGRAMASQIRDQQLRDKQIMEEKEKAYERRMDIATEVCRLKELQARELEEEAKMRKRITDQKVIEEQIEMRLKQKLLREEEMEQENRQINQLIKKHEEHEAKLAAQRAELVTAARLEVIKANEEALENKRTRKLLEQEEDKRMLAYQLQQDEKLRLRDAAEAEANHRKKELQKRMLENQSKVLDKQAEIDELRARRAIEEGERKHREKLLQEAQKRKHEITMLSQARKLHEEERRQAQELEKERKKEEYMRITKLAHDMARREEEEALAKEANNAIFKRDLKKQIEVLESNRRRGRNNKFEEGHRIKEDMAADRIKLEAIRDKRVNELRARGIEEKYLREMLSIDIGKLQMR